MENITFASLESGDWGVRIYRPDRDFTGYPLGKPVKVTVQRKDGTESRKVVKPLSIRGQMATCLIVDDESVSEPTQKGYKLWASMRLPYCPECGSCDACSECYPTTDEVVPLPDTVPMWFFRAGYKPTDLP